MGCRIDYDVCDGMLRAVVSGKSTYNEAAWIAHEIAEQAGSRTLSRVLIDVRRLSDRVGTLGALTSACATRDHYRVAVLDVAENDRYYALHEMVARQRGYALRRFSSAEQAAEWLRHGEERS